MIDFKNLTPAEVERACREAIEACDRGIEAIVATPAGERTFANTLVALESAVDHMAQAGGQYAFMAYVAPDDTLRETAREWEETLDKHGVELGFREDLYQAIREFAETPEAAGLSGDAKRLLDRTLRDYRRNGFELPKEQRERVQALMNRLVELGTVFRKAIDDWDDGILVERERLAGMPDRWIDGLKTVQEDGVTKYRVSLDYPEIMPFMDNAEDEQLRREMFIKNQNKGGADNVHVLEEAIRVRAEIASLLGYDSWASYVVEVRMAKQREHVETFLGDLETKLHVKADADMAALSRAKESHTGDPHINIWDWWFYTNLLHKTEYAVDDFAVAQYFPLERVVEGLFLVTQELLGIRYEPAKNASVWHEDVQAFDIFEADGDRPFARFYMDLYPRPNKFGHAAAFTMRGGRRLPDGSYQEPASAIVANFTKPTPDTPSLLRHTEVVTFFH